MVKKISLYICAGLAAFALYSAGFKSESLITRSSQDPILSPEVQQAVGVAKSLSKAFNYISAKGGPAVVFIKAECCGPEQDYYGRSPDGVNPYDSFHDEFFRRFFGTPPGYRQTPQGPQLSQGSGFLITDDGYIMTNFHVVKDATKLKVSLSNSYDHEFDASFIGGDPHTDIAIIKIEGKNYPYLELGDSSDVEQGDLVLAIGNPFGLKSSVTLGIISAKERQNLQITNLEDFLQTDAATNPGNSGGPLLNLDGKVIGINTAIVSRSGGNLGIGFAIPSNIANTIQRQLIDTGKVTRGFLGVALQPLDQDLAQSFGLKKTEGALVAEVVPDSPADQAGIKQGDVILEINGVPIKTTSTLKNEVLLMQPGTKTILTINRQGKMMKVPVTVGSHKSNQSAAASKAADKIGLEVENLTAEKAQQLGYLPNEEGVLVSNVKPRSLSALAGIRPGSIIITVNHKKVTNVEEFTEAIGNLDKDKSVLMLVKYKNQVRFVTLKVE